MGMLIQQQYAEASAEDRCDELVCSKRDISTRLVRKSYVQQATT